MNAHTPRKMIVAARAAGEACPAEALGRRIAALQAKITALDEERVATTPEAWPVEDLDEMTGLYDELNYLDRALEFAPPRSLAGVAIIVAQIGILADQMHDEDDVAGRALLRRRVIRLHRLAMDGLLQLGDLQAEEVGVAAKLFPAPAQ